MNVGVVGRRNQMCNLSSLKQFTILHWVQHTSLNRKDLVRKDGCIRKNPSVFQKMDRSRQYSRLWVYPFHVPFHWLNICSYDVSLFRDVSTLCVLSEVFVTFLLLLILFYTKESTMRLPSLENLYDRFFSRLFHIRNFIMMEEVQFLPSKKSICVSCWGQKCPVWCYPRAPRIPSLPSDKPVTTFYTCL